MKIFLISDNNDTAIGLRLAGIEGVVVHTESEVAAALENAAADEDIGLVLITEKLCASCSELILARKQAGARPLLVEIPDRDSEGRAGDSITRYVREAVGIKV